jgi:hypothetical protein
MRLQDFMNEMDMTDDEKKKVKAEDATRKKSKVVLKKELIKLDDHMDTFVEMIESEIDKIEDNPSFQYKIGLMLANMEKEQGEYVLALRQIVQVIGKKASIIPQTRAHAKGQPFDEKPEEAKDGDEEDVRDVVDTEQDKKKEEELEK